MTTPADRTAAIRERMADGMAKFEEERASAPTYRHPTSGDLSTVEQQVCRTAYGHWRAIASVNHWDSNRAGQVASIAGGSYDVDGERGWYQTTSKGIGWTPRMTSASDQPSTFRVFVSWTRLRDHFTSVTTKSLRERCAVQSTATHLNAGDRASFDIAAWQRETGCLVLTNDGYRAQVWEPAYAIWHAEWRALRDVEAELLDLIYPATAADAEPTDLLDLLALSDSGR